VPLAIKKGASVAKLPKHVKKFLMGHFINFAGIVTAGIVNLLCARQETLRTGIYAFGDINNPDTRTKTKSVKLGRRALIQCCLSRASMPFFYF